MKAKFPGRFVKFADIEPSEIFIHRYKSGTVLLALKARGENRDFAVEFRGASDKEPSNVMLDFNQQLAPDRTGLVLEELEIAPSDLTDFAARPPTGDIDPGWLGLAGDRAVLSFEHNGSGPGNLLVGYVDLTAGQLLNDAPEAGWFRNWRITRSGPKGPEMVFEMKR